MEDKEEIPEPLKEKYQEVIQVHKESSGLDYIIPLDKVYSLYNVFELTVFRWPPTQQELPKLEAPSKSDMKLGDGLQGIRHLVANLEDSFKGKGESTVTNSPSLEEALLKKQKLSMKLNLRVKKSQQVLCSKPFLSSEKFLQLFSLFQKKEEALDEEEAVDTVDEENATLSGSSEEDTEESEEGKTLSDWEEEFEREDRKYFPNEEQEQEEEEEWLEEIMD